GSNPYLSAILKKAAEFCSAAFLHLKNSYFLKLIFGEVYSQITQSHAIEIALIIISRSFSVKRTAKLKLNR
ncbi:hypothetical protein, partial [Photobacterium damselae]|uniref:hypothetical protein n=1 Tax=Photobacterium damselae TaxID=38293 RepID=UPI001C40930B